MTHYFTSDLHFGHNNIISHSGRPFNDVEEMNDYFIEMWNSTVKPTDTIICVGDFTAMTNKAILVMNLLLCLNGKKIMVPGNHDQRVLKKASQLPEFSSSNTILVEPLYEHRIGKDMVVVCHYPIQHWHKQRYNIPHVHGHIHSKIPLTGRNRVDVGWDAWGRIPSWQDIKDLIANNITNEFKLDVNKLEVDTHQTPTTKKSDIQWRTP